MTIFEFNDLFKTDRDCLEYLDRTRWANGFKCDECGCLRYGKGNAEFHRRCKECGKNHSPTSGTIFHKVKFSLRKAFYICYRISTSKKGMASTELSRELGLRQKTAWAFKRKIQEAMKSTGNFPLQGEIEVDEFAVGGPEIGEQGRSKGKKKLVALAVERPSPKTVGRAYALLIENYSSEEIEKLFKKHISKEAIIVADGWKAYDKLADDWNVYLEPSNNGEGFPKLHTIIMNFKSWMRGIHHKVGHKHMQAYIDEYFFRFNRRQFNHSVFDKLLERMINHNPYPFKAFST